LALALVVVAAGLATAVAVASARPASRPPNATIASFAGSWVGHTRRLLISRSGRATESVYDGCCYHVYTLTMQLSSPVGTTTKASVETLVTATHFHDLGTARHYASARAGSRGLLRLRSGVIADTLTRVTFCDRRADETARCGL
jgi:hypothetical protein